jgi:REP element-mobilizing transposase RayT
MPSHIHLIFRSAEGKPSELIRDFKGFTSKAYRSNKREQPRKPKGMVIMDVEKSRRKKF